MGLSTSLLNALDLVCKGTGNAEELASAVNNATTAIGSVTTTELATLHGVTPGTAAASSAAVLGTTKQLDTLAVASLVSGTTTTPGSANQAITIINKKTAIVDATPTSIFTVTCPNTTQTAVVELILLAAVNNAGALDSARVAVGYVVFDRVAGANLVATAAALTNTAIATSGTATLTLAYSAATVSGGATAVNTIDIQVTLTKTGGTNHQIVALATIINSEATGMTIAAD